LTRVLISSNCRPPPLSMDNFERECGSIFPFLDRTPPEKPLFSLWASSINPPPLIVNGIDTPSITEVNGLPSAFMFQEILGGSCFHGEISLMYFFPRIKAPFENDGAIVSCGTLLKIWIPPIECERATPAMFLSF